MRPSSKKGVLFLFTLLATLPSALAYIDPGTGGYLITTLWSSILTILAIAFTIVAGFFSRKIIEPIKIFWSNHKKISLGILIIALLVIGIISYYSFHEEKATFDPALSGGWLYKPQQSALGYNLENGQLRDMQGKIVHEWKNGYMGVIDTNGDFYGQEGYESPTWGRYTWNDTPVWEMDLPIHHEIRLTPQDTLLVATKNVHEYQERNVEFSVILEFDKNGTLLDSWSAWDNLEYMQQWHKPLALDKSPSTILPENHKKEKTSIWGGNYDYYHLNSIAVVPENAREGSHPAFNPGNWIISFRHGSMVFILDKDTKEVLWRAVYDQIEDNLEGQHSAQMLPSGNILLFDNGRYREWSRIIEIDPATLNIIWEYSADDFYTESQGYVQVLGNNNLMITESEKGRAFEITKQKELVWEFYHPEIQNTSNSLTEEHHGERQWMYRMLRYDAEFINQFLEQ